MAAQGTKGRTEGASGNSCARCVECKRRKRGGRMEVRAGAQGGQRVKVCWDCVRVRELLAEIDAVRLERNALRAQAQCARVERNGLEKNLAAARRERDLAQRRVESQKRSVLHLVGMLCEERDRSAALGQEIENDQWRREMEMAARPQDEAQAPAESRNAVKEGGA